MKLFTDEETHWLAFDQGYGAWKDYLETGIKTSNPYPENTNEWYSWNKGWNYND